MISEDIIKRPIFIVGPGRSGTTLLRSMLNAHSHISVTPETQFMNWVSERGDIHGEPSDFDRFWATYTSWVRFIDLDVDPNRCLELVDRQGMRTFENILRAVLAAYSERVGKERVGEKSPSHVRYLPELTEWFPDARFIVMQRDPRAVIASQLKTPYVRKGIKPLSLRGGVLQNKRLNQIAYYAADWAQICEHIMPTWEDDPRVLIVSYEALVQEPDGELRDICSFLEEPFETAMLTDRAKAGRSLPAGITPDGDLEEWRRKHYAKSMGSVSSDSIEKWRHELTGVEVALIEGCCEKGMAAKGYTFSLAPPKRSLGRFLIRGVSAMEAGEARARDLYRWSRQRLRAPVTAA